VTDLNENKRGYKKTKVGWIPNDWKTRKIGETCEFSSGNGFRPADWTDRGLPIIRIQNLNGGTKFNYFAGEPKPEWLVHPGDLLFAWAGVKGVSFGPTIWSGDRGVLNQHIYKVSPSPDFDFNWLYLALKDVTRDIEKRAHGFKSSLVHVHKQDIVGATVAIPPLPEQAKIAKILSTWDQAIDQTRKLVDAKKKRKRALIQMLVSGNKRLPRFRNHEWKCHRFGDFLTESRIAGEDGRHSHKISIKLYGKGIGKRKELRAGSKNTKYYTRKAGQLIYSKLDFLNGAFAIIPESLEGFQSTLDLPSFDIAPTINSDWLINFLCRDDFYRSCMGYASGGRKARRVNPKQLLQMKVSVPSIDEQQAVSTLLSTASKEIISLEQKLEALEKQKCGLMQKLLTGTIRVRV